MTAFNVVEATIAELRAALSEGRTKSVDLVESYLDRIAQYDSPDSATALNSVVVLNEHARAEAHESDRRRALGHSRGALEGIPYTAKDSYLAAGLTAAAGSPAFENLIAHHDAFVIERLRAAGAILIGLTNMPPMADGGMQRGLYGRAESPYNPEWLTSAFGSGSSNGSGTSTAASFAAFGLGEETWSSGRAPASNNGLCAYTPSRGIISVRGSWPLVPTMDVVVPHTRTMADLLEVLDIIVADDPQQRGDFWRTQPWVAVPGASQHRPESYAALALDPNLDPDPDRSPGASGALHGKRIGVPKMYINADAEAGTGASVGIGGPTGQRIETRASIIALWEAARTDLELAGAEVVEVDFAIISNYEGDRPGASTIHNRGLVSPDFLHTELLDLAAWAWQDFLEANGDPALNTLTGVEPDTIFPEAAGSVPSPFPGFPSVLHHYPALIRERTHTDLPQPAVLEAGLRGLDETRRIDFDIWIDKLGLDAIVFPTVADVGPANMDVDHDSAKQGWRNGVWVANGNLAIRHFGIPTVTVPMGIMTDIRMPVGLTFAGRPYDDVSLLTLAAAFEATGSRRLPPPLTAQG